MSKKLRNVHTKETNPEKHLWMAPVSDSIQRKITDFVNAAFHPSSDLVRLRRSALFRSRWSLHYRLPLILGVPKI